MKMRDVVAWITAHQTAVAIAAGMLVAFVLGWALG